MAPWHGAHTLPFALTLRTQAQWLAATGLTLSNLYLCEDADTQLTDEIGTAHLPEGGTPLYEQSTPWSKVGVGFTPGEADYFGADVFADDGVTSQMWGGISVNPTTKNRWVCGRYTSGGQYLRVLFDPNGYWEFAVGDGTGNAIAEVAVDHQGESFPWIAGIDHNASKIFIATPHGRAEASISTLGTLGATTPSFRIGDLSGSIPCDNVVPLFFRCTGAEAELSAAEQTALIDTLQPGIV